MSKANATAEPSMEEILASIRRIIADGDEAPKAAAPKPEPVVEKPAPAKASTAKPVTKPEVSASQDDIDALMAADPMPAQKQAPKPPAPASQDDIDAMMAAMEDDKVDIEEEDEDILDLAMARAEKEVTAPAPRAMPKPAPKLIDNDDIDFAEAAEIVAPLGERAPRSSSPAASQPVVAMQNSLLSHETEMSVASAFGSLTQAIFSNEPRTIEDVMKELLRPMVKTWLDDNLPAVVERLVREEISRVARGKR